MRRGGTLVGVIGWAGEGSTATMDSGSGSNGRVSVFGPKIELARTKARQRRYMLRSHLIGTILR